MRAVIQRVSQASVTVDDEIIGEIEQGLLVLFAVHHDDQPQDSEWFVNKTLTMRIFEDDQGKMNQSVVDTGGGVLVVSQFTLYGSCSRGRRPDFLAAAEPSKAKAIYDQFVTLLDQAYPKVETGQFAAKMSVSLVNDGPVTLILEGPSKQASNN